MNITALISARGNAVANQYSVDTANGTYFQSYETVIARRQDGTVCLSSAWNYSATTLKYLKVWLGVTLSKAQIQARIDDGVYALVDTLTIK